VVAVHGHRHRHRHGHGHGYRMGMVGDLSVGSTLQILIGYDLLTKTSGLETACVQSSASTMEKADCLPLPYSPSLIFSWQAEIPSFSKCPVDIFTTGVSLRYWPGRATSLVLTIYQALNRNSAHQCAQTTTNTESETLGPLPAAAHFYFYFGYHSLLGLLLHCIALRSTLGSVNLLNVCRPV